MRIPTVCGEYLHNLLDFLAGRGLRERQLQAVLGWRPTEHVTDSGRFPLRLFEHLLEASARLLGDAHLGARAGASCSRAPWAIVDYLRMSASNNREALVAAINYSRLVIDHGDMELREQDELARLTWVLPSRALPSPQVVEFFFASWYWTNRDMLRRHCRQRRVFFAHGARGEPGTLERLLEAPVAFNQPHNAVEVDSELLDCPGSFPDPRIQASLQATAQAELAALNFEDRVIRDVKDFIAQCLNETMPTLEVVAEELGISDRTLQRRLGDADTSFKSLVEDVRRERLQMLLLDRDKSLVEVAAELGYCNQSAFHRAFRRWYGQSPGRYRQLLLAG